jgi:hypothetical protein
MLRGVGRDRPAKANDARLAATLVFARTITEKRGRVSDEDVAAVRARASATPRSSTSWRTSRSPRSPII